MEEIIDRIIKLKNKINLFKNMEDEDIKQILKDINFVSYQIGETIIKEGDTSEEIFILLDGKCKVNVGRTNVGIIEINQAFGEFSAITKSPRHATVRALRPCKVISFKIAFDVLEKELHGFSILYKNFVDELIIKIDSTNLEKRKGNFL